MYWSDPLGLLNIIAGGGGSIVPLMGGESSLGAVINPGFGDDEFDFGGFASYGVGAGWNVSGDAFIGYTEGCFDDLDGKTLNTNFGLGVFSFSVFKDPNTLEIVGGTAGLGAFAPYPAGLSETYSHTESYSVWKDIKKWLKLNFGF